MRIIHRCDTCGYADFNHNDTQVMAGYVNTPRHKVTPGPAVLIPTYRIDGTVNPVIETPGAEGARAGLPRSCDCTECVALFEQVSA